jgi:hypothetical protein
MRKCLLLTNSSVKHSLSIYLLIIIIYFCSYNPDWDENQVLFPRLITILFHETHHHLYLRKSSTSYHIWKQILWVYNYWITTAVSFPFISRPVVAVVSLADAV